MGNRLSKIVTRTGDDGTTGLADGSRLPKDAPRIEAIGAVDELNCALGMLLSSLDTPVHRPGEGGAELIRDCLSEIQHDLFDLGGELAIPGHALINDERVATLEQHVEHFNNDLPPLKEFVLPGGGSAAAACHVARAICRRAERRCWQLSRNEQLGAPLLRYLNRLSDLLFVLARTFARRSGGGEVLWRSRRVRSDAP